MPIDSKVKKQVIDLVCGVCDRMDPSKKNSNLYRTKFETMDDKAFTKWMKEFYNDPYKYIIIQMEGFNKKTEPNLDRIKDAADFLKIELDEYIIMPFINPEGEAVRSQYKVPIGYLHMKRMQQLLSKKNSFSININQRNMKTNQVTSDSKSGRVSDAEMYALVANDCKFALQEFFGPRADDSVMKEQMSKQINLNGYVKLSELDSDTKNKQTLNTVDTYFMGAGLVTDLLTPGYAFRYTLDSRKVAPKIADKYQSMN